MTTAPLVAFVQRPVPPLSVATPEEVTPMVRVSFPGWTASVQDWLVLGWAMLQWAPAGVTTLSTPGPLAVTFIGEPANIPQVIAAPLAGN